MVFWWHNLIGSVVERHSLGYIRNWDIVLDLKRRDQQEHGHELHDARHIPNLNAPHRTPERVELCLWQPNPMCLKVIAYWGGL